MVLFHKLTGAENQNVITARISDGLRNQPEITASPSFNEPVVTFLNLFLLTMWKWQKKKELFSFDGKKKEPKSLAVQQRSLRNRCVQMPWDSHEGWGVLDVVQFPRRRLFTGWRTKKMFPLRAGRSHFSLSNFQMQEAWDGMSAYVR